jgi:hypothetical protein
MNRGDTVSHYRIESLLGVGTITDDAWLRRQTPRHLALGDHQ